jgi:hypothetical protein
MFRRRTTERGAASSARPVRAARASVVAVVLGGSLACGGDAVLTLGAGDPSPAFGDSGQRIRNVNEAETTEFGATLTGDLLEVFFVSDRPGGMGDTDIWYAARGSRTDPFDEPVLLAAASSTLGDVSPAISADGLTLWVGSERELGQGGMDVWRLQRSARGAEWGPIENVAALNSAEHDLPRPLGLAGSVMPLASTRAGGGSYQTFLAWRDGPEQDFATIQPLDALWTPDASMEAACLTDDGLFLFFTRATRDAFGDLYLAWRTSTRDPFREPIALSAINSADDERDPFLSADRFRFFFSRTRLDRKRLDIYATSIDIPVYQ